MARSFLALAALSFLAPPNGHGPCRARAGVKLPVDQAGLSSAVASEIAGAGLASTTYVDSATSGLALASDLTSLDGRVSTAESTLTTVSSDLASKANSSDLAAKADASDLTSLDDAVKAAAGKPFARSDTLTGSGGTDKFGTAWSMPYALVDGHDYELDLVFTMTNGATQLGTVTQSGWKGRYDASLNGGDGGWVETQEAQTTYKIESGTVDVGTGVFGNASHLPGMDVSADSAVLSTVARPRNGQSVTIAVDGKLRDLGDNVA